MSEDLAGRINGWRCQPPPEGIGARFREACGKITYAVHVHHGVTPMFLACRASGHEPDHPDNPCKGTGVSLMYPSDPAPRHVIDAIAWEWYKPDAAELAQMRKRARRRARRGDHSEFGAVEHVLKGGLLLRPLTDAGRELLERSAA